MAGHSIMVNPAVVPSDHEHASGPTNSSKHPDLLTQSPNSGRMEGLW